MSDLQRVDICRVVDPAFRDPVGGWYSACRLDDRTWLQADGTLGPAPAILPIPADAPLSPLHARLRLFAVELPPGRYAIGWHPWADTGAFAFSFEVVPAPPGEPWPSSFGAHIEIRP